uniref:Zinc transporter 9 n=1 Tax=Meloidogyne hapla TaxID=6305 RepID=A0A1I8B7J0_MELHA
MLSNLSKNILTARIHNLHIRFSCSFSGRPGLLTIVDKSVYLKKPDIAKLGTFQGAGDGNIETKLSNKVVKFAVFTNLADFLVKATAAYMTLSNSLFAETLHSCVFAYSKYIFKICSLSSGFGILAFGCGLSVYNGIQGFVNPSELESLSWGIGLLFISASLQCASFTRAFFEVRRRARNEGLSVKQYLISAGADPSIKVVLLEDAASITGVLIALTCVSLTHLTGTTGFDSFGSILIGLVLGTAAYQIIWANALHLVGRSLPESKQRQIIAYMTEDPIIKVCFLRRMHDVKATYMDVNDCRFKAEIEYNGREITKLYLKENCDMDELQQQISKITNKKELEEFMLLHGEKLIDRVGDEVDRLERKFREKYPEFQHIDLESS